MASINLEIVDEYGKICLGKKYAGKQVQILELDDGTITIKTSDFIPDNEKWLYQGDNLEELMEAVEWAENSPRKENFKEIERRILEHV